MFDSKKEVPSLELCKKLKELGYPQDGGWYWKKWKEKENWKLGFVKEEEKQYFLTYVDLIKAPTVRELGEWLPAILKVKNHNFFLIIKQDFIGGQFHWLIGYMYETLHSSVHLNDSIHRDIFEANARAKMLIWLVENSYVNFKR